MSISLQSHSQTLNFIASKSKSKGFDITASTKTSTITIETISFDVFSTKSGSKFIKMRNTSGVEYAFWIGEEIGETVLYNQKPYKLRQCKNGGQFVLTLKNGKPSRIMGSIE